MQASNNVKLACAFPVRFSGHLDTFFDRPIIGLGMADSSVETAECAIGYADVGIIQMAVYVVICEVAILSLADAVCECTYGNKVVGFQQGDSVIEGKPLSSRYLFGDWN